MSEKLELKLNYGTILIIDFSKPKGESGNFIIGLSDGDIIYDFIKLQSAKQIIEFLQKHIGELND